METFIPFIITVEECWMACPIVGGGGSFSQARVMLVSLAVVSVVRRVRAAEIDHSILLSLKHLMKMVWGLTKQAIKI